MRDSSFPVMKPGKNKNGWGPSLGGLDSCPGAGRGDHTAGGDQVIPGLSTARFHCDAPSFLGVLKQGSFEDPSKNNLALWIFHGLLGRGMG